MTSQRKNTDIKLANTCTGQVQTVRVEGCSTSGQLQLSAGNTGGWEEFEEEVDRALDRALERELDGEAERSRRQTIRSVQEERRTQMIEDNRLSSIARGKNFPHNPQLHGQPSNFRTSKPTSTNQRRQKKRRKIRVRNELIILDGVELSALTQFDLAASAIISPTSLGGLVEGKNVHMAYHLWTAVKKTLDDDILMDSFRDINLRDDARTWGLLSDCVFEQMIVELGTANTDRLAVTDSKERRRKEIFLFIDPRKSNDASAIVRSARRISALFLHKNRRDESEQEIELFISIPATQQGIQASHELEKTGIKTNLTQVASLEHARICETYARVSCVTMDIGSIQKWFERREKHRMTRDLAQDLAIDKVREIARHLRAGPGRSVTVKVLGENFRTAADIGLLAGDLDGVVLNQTTLNDIIVATIDKRRSGTSFPTHTAIQTAGHGDGPPAALSLAGSSIDNNDVDDGKHLLEPELPKEQDPLEPEPGPLHLTRSLSAESHSIYAGTLCVALGSWQFRMNKIQEFVEKELKRQVELNTLALKKLYHCWKPKQTSQANGNIRDSRSSTLSSRSTTVVVPTAPADQEQESQLHENDRTREVPVRLEAAIIEDIIRSLLGEEEEFEYL